MQAVVAAFVAVGKFVAINVLGVGVYSTATLAAIGATVVVAGVTVAKKAMSLFEVEMPTVDTDASRQTTVKSTTEPQKIIYGEALVSGPISFIGLSGTDNSDLYQTIVLAGHEVTEITDIHMDDIIISNSAINAGSTAGGNVTSGTFGPKNSNTICIINKHLGEASQTADVLLTGPFTNYTADHRGDGIAYLAMKWTLNEDSAETWNKFAPQNVKALVKGKPVYDPRLDTGAPNYNPLDQLFITYNATAGNYVGQGQNPALVLADYLISSDLGMGISPSKIDWSSFITAANGCDVSVSVPGGTEKRFTCNGVIFATDSHQKNINKILSSMNGNLVYSNGKYIVHAGIYEAPTETLTEDDLIGAISINTSLERSDRFNTIKGLFIDPAQNHKSTEFPKVQLADAVTRDNGEILEKEVQYPMTNSSYMAQRLSNKLIQLSDQQKVVSFPANLSALRITAGDRVQVSVEELNWSNKVFQCAGWTFSEDGGVNLTLREDSSTSYADPAVNEYSTITATGSITDAFRGVPSPSGLTATAGLKSIELNWVNPAKPNDFGTIYVYASRNANFSSAIKIGETDGTQFIHDASNKSLIFFPSVVNVGDTYTIRTLGNTDFVAMGAASNTVGVVFTATSTGSGTGNLWETLSPGDLRYYWVRAVKNVGTDAASQSNLEPNTDPNTTVFATVGRVEWADVSGSTDAPEDNATVGATISENLYDIDSVTVLGVPDVKNQVIVNIETEDNIILETEVGNNLFTQEVGDVGLTVKTELTALRGQYSVKIDNNGRVAGFGLSSVAPNDLSSPAVSEFNIIADKFQVVNPAATTDNPLPPFIVTGDKIYLNTDVRVNGDLLTTGTTISNVALQVGANDSFFKVSTNGLQLGNETFASAPFRVTPQGALTANSATIVGNVTANSGSIGGVNVGSSKIYVGTGTYNNANTGFYLDSSGNFSLKDKLSFDGTTLTVNGGGTFSGDLSAAGGTFTGDLSAAGGTFTGALSGGTISIGTGNDIFKADSNGIYLGNASFISAPFSVSQAGVVNANNAIISGTVTATSFDLASGATLIDVDGAIANAQQLMSEVSGVIDENQHNIPGFYRITTDDTLAPSNAEFIAESGRYPKVEDIVITIDTSATPDRTYSWKCTVAGSSGVEATWSNIAEFISGDLIVDGTVSADKIVTNNLAAISADLGTVTAGSLAATLITGDVTENFAVSYADSTLNLNTVTNPFHSVFIPAPEGGISKRQFAQIRFVCQASTSGNGNQDIAIAPLLYRKTKGEAGTLIGTVAVANTPSGGYQQIKILGNVSEQMSPFGGGIDSTSNGSSIIDYRWVNAVWFDGTYTIIEAFTLGGTDSWSATDSVYFSADGFLSAGVDLSISDFTETSAYLIDGGRTQNITIPYFYLFGSSTTATEIGFGLSVANGSLSTVNFRVLSGMLGNLR